MKTDQITISESLDNPAELNEDNLPDDPSFVVFDPGTTKGNAFRHEVEWQVWTDESESNSLEVTVATERATPFYRSVQGSITADRKQYSAFSTLVPGATQFYFGTTQYRNNLNELISIHTLEEHMHEAQISIDIASLLDQSRSEPEDVNDPETTRSWQKAVPSSADFSAQFQGMKTLNGDVIILAPVIEGFDFMNQTTDSFGFNFNWEGEHNSTSFGIDYNYLDNKQRERADADTRDLVYRLSHEITKNHWSVAAQIGLTRSSDYDTSSRANTRVSEWGLSGSYETQNGINFYLTFDRSSNSLNDLIFDEREDSLSDVYSISAELGQWVGQKMAMTNDPSVTLNFQSNRSTNVSPYYASDQTSRAFTVNIGVPF